MEILIIFQVILAVVTAVSGVYITITGKDIEIPY